MRLFILITSVTLCSPISAQNNRFFDYKVKAGYLYTTDTLDFSDEKKEHSVYRGSLLFSKDSSLNLTVVNINRGAEQDGEKRMTWNLVLNDISDNMSITGGNFFAGFGAGLMVGKKSYMSSDPHASAASFSSEKTLSPCSTGNPVYAFNGVGALLSADHGENSSRAVIFYSLRDRFAEWESSDSMNSDSSYGAISDSGQSSTKRPEPVNIHDAAAMYEFRVKETLRFQIYGLRSFMRMPGGGDFLWNYAESENGGTGERSYAVMGFFAGYKDDAVDMFCEVAYSERGYESNDGKRENAGGPGAVFGFNFKHPDVKFSASVKKTKENFYARYGSGRVDPENTMYLALRVRLINGLWMGGEYSGEKRVVPPYNGSGLPAAKREKLFFEYRINPENMIEAIASRTESDSGSDLSRYTRFSAKYSLSKKLWGFSLRGTAQLRNNYDRSYMGGGSVKAGPWRGFAAGAEYWYINAADKNPVYSSAGMWGSISGGGFVYESCHTGAASISFKKNELKLSAGYLRSFNKGVVVDEKLQFSGEYTL